MIRSLFTASTGMIAQQMNIDTIAHNLANVNTTGFKKSRVNFQDLLYETIKPAGTQTANGTTIPEGIPSIWPLRARASSRSPSPTARRATPATALSR
jgi:flagellar basal-body rod protein FlgG